MEDEQLNLFYEIKEEVVDDGDTKVCIECNERKNFEAFPIDTQAYRGRKNTCRECKNTSKRAVRWYRRKNRYPDENYECPICEKKQELIRRTGHSWVVDHCHTTGIFRGYLCRSYSSV